MDQQSNNVAEFPASEQEDNPMGDEAEQTEETEEQQASGDNVADFDVEKQEEKHKQKMTEISEALNQIDDAEIVKACEMRQAIDKKRDVLNKEAAEIREKLKELGISGPAFNAAYDRYKQNAHKRDVFDQEFAKCANALDVGFTKDLF